jgi:predicted negative regulator of RcsB-dependent stress response
VSVHLSEEEQLEVLKRWWKDYGKTVIIAVLVAVVGYFGYTTWQDQKRQKAEKASEVYEQLLKLTNAEPGKTLTDSDKATIAHLAGELKDGNSKSMYAHSAAFFLAKLAVEDNKLDIAVSELKWVLSAKPDAATEQLARLRLARVFLKLQGDLDAARTAYEKALAATDPQQQERYMLLQMKVDDLKVDGPVPAAPAEEKAQ